MILKIGEALGINFNSEIDAYDAIRQVENRDGASSSSSRASRRPVAAMLRVRNPFFKVQYKKTMGRGPQEKWGAI